MRSLLRENQPLKPTARTLWEVQEKCHAFSVETATNLYVDVLRRAERALKQGEDRRRKIVDGESLRQYQAQARSLFLTCIGGLPATARTPAKEIGRQDYENFTLEKVLLAPREGSFASANVYCPRGKSGPHPAVLVVVGHTDLGKADPEYQRLAQLLAYSGFVTLVLDPVGEGERFEHYEADLDLQPIQGCSGEHDLLDWKCKLMGFSLARYFVQDGLAALDYLASRPDVNPARIALTGHSGGGTQTCMLMLAAGERFAAAAPCAYVTDTQAMMECGVDPDNEMLWPGSIAQGLDYVDLLAGMAPKPLLLLTAQHDFFPREGTLRVLKQARALWRAAGGTIPPQMATACSDHAYTESLARAVARFFSRHLLGEERNLDDFSFVPLPERALRCTPDGSLLKECPNMRTIHEELMEELDACRARRREADEAPEAWLGKAIGYDPDAAPEPRVFGEGICGHYAYRCLAWRPQAGYWNVGALLRDMRQGDKPLPTVIALWPEGLSRLTEHAHWIHCAVQRGWQVLVMDVTASGTLLPATLGCSSMYIGWGTLFKLNAYLLQLDDSLLGLRVRQAAAAAHMLRQWPEADGDRLCYWGQGDFSRYAALAGLLTGTPVCADEAYQRYEEIVAERYHDQTHTHEWAFPGVLKHFDMPDISARLKGMGLWADDPAGINER